MTRFMLALSLFTGSALPVFAAQISGFIDVGGVFASFNDPLVSELSGETLTFAYGINNAGQIVGSYSDATSAAGINAAGQIVGSYTDATGIHGFLDSGGTFTTIDGPFASLTRASGINDSGEIVGFMQTPEPSTPVMTFAALLSGWRAA
jgi:hypothetical protein